MGEGYYKYWGKADKEGNFHLLPYHCLDVAAIGWHLFAPETQRSKDFCLQTGLSPDLIRFLVVYGLMLHDIGKFSLTFQALLPSLFQRLFPDCKERRYKIRHDTLGFVLWREHTKPDLLKISRSLTELLEFIIRAFLGHHGLPPEESARGGSMELRASSYFQAEEIAAAGEFFKDTRELLGEPSGLPDDWKQYKKIMRAISWNIAGIAVISDWIGSNDKYFPYKSESMHLSEYWQNWALPQAEKALYEVGWRTYQANSFSDGSSLKTLFPFIHEPTPLQSLALTVPLMDGPKLFILEDVTGAGKTEASIILSSRIMSRGDADGLYIGLPTMATANAMYERMQEPYRKLYKDGETPSLILSHGARHLSSKFTETVVAHEQKNDTYDNSEQTASAVCNLWYADSRKKALLADVGVGTIDQALLGVLPARHQSLRLLGLQRKILIIDEVHAYDPYMEHLLEVLLEAHARGGGSAILLSATIPVKKRGDLIAAFRAGLSMDEPALPPNSENEFPLVTQAGAVGTEVYPIGTRLDVCRGVGASFLYSNEIILQFIEQKALAGECVCWIRNTVKDARKTFNALLNRGIIAKERLDLFHSRFAMVDRARIETNVLGNFGPKSGQTVRQGRVLIATQVVEQSLDLDFDQMITDLAPIDLVIQRAGRLHRHVRDKYGNKIKEECATDERPSPVIHIFAPEFVENADNKWLSGEFAGTVAVYSNAGRLWKTQKSLIKNKGWKMPEDARELIETVYGEADSFDIPEGLLEKIIRAVGEEQSKESIGHLNALMLEKGYCREAVLADQWDTEERIPTRLSEENVEVVLAVSENGKLVPYAEAEKYSWDWSCLSISYREWKKVNYVLPERHQKQVDEMKETIPRLKFTNIVIVSHRSGEALTAGQPVLNFYDSRMGWGNDLEKEA